MQCVVCLHEHGLGTYPVCVTLSARIRSRIFTPFGGIVFVLIVGLVVKYGWSLFVFDLPMGYDVGFYRYLFIRHAEGLPPFITASLDPWARGHPLGLFFLSSLLVQLGIPVDWLIGWMWNACAVLLLCTFSWISGKRYGPMIGMWTLVAALLSISTFDGFAAMYWKTIASMLWMILALFAIERRSWVAVFFGLFTVITHHQTGLLFGLVVLSYFLLPFFPFVRPTRSLSLRSVSLRDVAIVGGAGCSVIVLGLLAYAPIWKDAVLQHLPALLGETEAASGSFPPALFYVQVEAIVLFFGALGMYWNICKERWTVWQLPVLWSLLFVVLHLLFYRRFFLQFEFFLLPFVAIGLDRVWQAWKDTRVRVAVLVLLLIQGFVMQQAIRRHGPLLEQETFTGIIQGIESGFPDDAFLLGLENMSPVILRGWYPYARVGGPGLFDAPWSEEQWRTILLGSNSERAAILESLRGPLYLFVTPYFRRYYGEYAEIFLQDPCLHRVGDTEWYRWNCNPQ